MFRSNWTILRERMLSLAKATILWNWSVKVHRFMICCVVATSVSGCDVCTAWSVVCDSQHCTQYSLKYLLPQRCDVCILRSECGGTLWRKGGEVKGKLANGVGSQYSHKTSERGVSSITNADAHTSAASSRLNWLPRRFKWTRPFRRKTKCGFCACAIRFQTSSTACLKYLLAQRSISYDDVLSLINSTIL
jgi:hypothetical protein